MSKLFSPDENTNSTSSSSSSSFHRWASNVLSSQFLPGETKAPPPGNIHVHANPTTTHALGRLSALDSTFSAGLIEKAVQDYITLCDVHSSYGEGGEDGGTGSTIASLHEGLQRLMHQRWLLGGANVGDWEQKIRHTFDNLMMLAEVSVRECQRKIVVASCADVSPTSAMLTGNDPTPNYYTTLALDSEFTPVYSWKDVKTLAFRHPQQQNSSRQDGGGGDSQSEEDWNDYEDDFEAEDGSSSSSSAYVDDDEYADGAQRTTFTIPNADSGGKRIRSTAHKKYTRAVFQSGFILQLWDNKKLAERFASTFEYVLQHCCSGLGTPVHAPWTAVIALHGQFFTVSAPVKFLLLAAGSSGNSSSSATGRRQNPGSESVAAALLPREAIEVFLRCNGVFRQRLNFSDGKVADPADSLSFLQQDQPESEDDEASEEEEHKKNKNKNKPAGNQGGYDAPTVTMHVDDVVCCKVGLDGRLYIVSADAAVLQPRFNQSYFAKQVVTDAALYNIRTLATRLDEGVCSVAASSPSSSAASSSRDYSKLVTAGAVAHQGDVRICQVWKAYAECQTDRGRSAVVSELFGRVLYDVFQWCVCHLEKFDLEALLERAAVAAAHRDRNKQHAQIEEDEGEGSKNDPAQGENNKNDDEDNEKEDDSVDDGGVVEEADNKLADDSVVPAILRQHVDNGKKHSEAGATASKRSKKKMKKNQALGQQQDENEDGDAVNSTSLENTTQSNRKSSRGSSRAHQPPLMARRVDEVLSLLHLQLFGAGGNSFVRYVLVPLLFAKYEGATHERQLTDARFPDKKEWVQRKLSPAVLQCVNKEAAWSILYRKVKGPNVPFSARFDRSSGAFAAFPQSRAVWRFDPETLGSFAWSPEAIHDHDRENARILKEVYLKIFNRSSNTTQQHQQHQQEEGGGEGFIIAMQEQQQQQQQQYPMRKWLLTVLRDAHYADVNAPGFLEEETLSKLYSSPMDVWMIVKLLSQCLYSCRAAPPGGCLVGAGALGRPPEEIADFAQIFYEVMIAFIRFFAQDVMMSALFLSGYLPVLHKMQRVLDNCPPLAVGDLPLKYADMISTVQIKQSTNPSAIQQKEYQNMTLVTGGKIREGMERQAELVRWLAISLSLDEAAGGAVSSDGAENRGGGEQQQKHAKDGGGGGAASSPTHLVRDCVVLNYFIFAHMWMTAAHAEFYAREVAATKEQILASLMLCQRAVRGYGERRECGRYLEFQRRTTRHATKARVSLQRFSWGSQLLQRCGRAYLRRLNICSENEERLRLEAIEHMTLTAQRIGRAMLVRAGLFDLRAVARMQRAGRGKMGRFWLHEQKARSIIAKSVRAFAERKDNLYKAYHLMLWNRRARNIQRITAAYEARRRCGVERSERRRQHRAALLMGRVGRAFCTRRRIMTSMRLLALVFRGFAVRLTLHFENRARIASEERRQFDKLLSGEGWATYEALLQQNRELTREIEELNFILDRELSMTKLQKLESLSVHSKNSISRLRSSSPLFSAGSPSASTSSGAKTPKKKGERSSSHLAKSAERPPPRSGSQVAPGDLLRSEQYKSPPPSLQGRLLSHAYTLSTTAAKTAPGGGGSNTSPVVSSVDPQQQHVGSGCAPFQPLVSPSNNSKKFVKFEKRTSRSTSQLQSNVFLPGGGDTGVDGGVDGEEQDDDGDDDADVEEDQVDEEGDIIVASRSASSFALAQLRKPKSEWKAAIGRTINLTDKRGKKIVLSSIIPPPSPSDSDDFIPVSSPTANTDDEKVKSRKNANKKKSSQLLRDKNDNVIATDGLGSNANAKKRNKYAFGSPGSSNLGSGESNSILGPASSPVHIVKMERSHKSSSSNNVAERCDELEQRNIITRTRNEQLVTRAKSILSDAKRAGELHEQMQRLEHEHAAAKQENDGLENILAGQKEGLTATADMESSFNAEKKEATDFIKMAKREIKELEPQGPSAKMIESVLQRQVARQTKKNELAEGYNLGELEQEGGEGSTTIASLKVEIREMDKRVESIKFQLELEKKEEKRLRHLEECHKLLSSTKPTMAQSSAAEVVGRTQEVRSPTSPDNNKRAAPSKTVTSSSAGRLEKKKKKKGETQ